MSIPYAYIQYAKDGQAWLFMDGDPIVPIHLDPARMRAHRGVG